MTPLLIDDKVRSRIKVLAELAQAFPVNMGGITERLATPEGKRAHMEQMTAQTIPIPYGFLVTYSRELNHPCGECRHMSMSVQAEGRLPSPQAVWEVAKEFGFHGQLHDNAVWIEKLQGHGNAVNIVQPVEQPKPA